MDAVACPCVRALDGPSLVEVVVVVRQRLGDRTERDVELVGSATEADDRPASTTLTATWRTPTRVPSIWGSPPRMSLPDTAQHSKPARNTIVS